METRTEASVPETTEVDWSKTKDIRCPLTQSSRLLTRKDGQQVVAPILSLRTRPNSDGVVFKYGKRAGQLKPYKHKDCQ